ncbi:fasciclin domain-containing protein, partial [Methanoculleus taiwanensis]
QNQTANMTQNQTQNQTANMTQNQTQNQTANMTQTMMQAQNMTELRTLLGENLTVSLNQTTNQVMVNNASVIQPDINASNGVIHVIDQVLMPPNMTIGNVTGNQTVGNESVTITGNESTLVVVNDTSLMTTNQTIGNQTGNQTVNQTAGNQTTDNLTNMTVSGLQEYEATIVENGSTVTYINRTV